MNRIARVFLSAVLLSCPALLSLEAKDHRAPQILGGSIQWVADRDLVANEISNRPQELFAINPIVSEWSYGYRDVPEATGMTLYSPAQHSNHLLGDAGQGWGLPDPFVQVNAGTTDIIHEAGYGPLYPIHPGELAMHPGPGTVSVLRWRAPVAGAYNVTAVWQDLDNHGGDGAAAHVVRNGVQIFTQQWDNDGGAEFPSQTLNLAAGDVLDFVLSGRSDYTFDTTRVNATITPEGFNPASFLANTGFTVFDRSQPLSDVADAVLTFAAAQSFSAGNVAVRVQATTTPAMESSWAELPDGNFGLMVRDASTGLWVLNSTNYPHENGVYFRAISVAADVPPNVGNVVGPFNLASSVNHVGPTLLRINGDGSPGAISPGEPLEFRVEQESTHAAVRIQTSSTPHEEGSWTDFPGGNLAYDSADGAFHGTSGNYPTGDAVYFRAISTQADSIASLSNIVGPFDFTSLTDPSVTGLWEAGRDLKANEKPDRAEETAAVNATVPEWSYGYRDFAAGNAFTAFTPDRHVSAISGNEDLEGFLVSENGLLVAVNTGGEPVVRDLGFGDHKPIFPGQLLLGPSNANAFAVVRWTAPAAGSYRILAKWIDLDAAGGNGASGHVVINGTEVFGRKVPADEVGPERFVGQEWENGGNAVMPAATFRLNAGDVVDFALGSRGDFSFDNTTFNAAIRRVPTVTIPNAQEESFTVEGADLDLPVEVESERPVTKVTLLIDGQFASEDTAAPYRLTFENISSGTHYLTVVARDEAGVENVSATLKLVALKNPDAANSSAVAARGETLNAGQVSAPLALGKTYFCTQSGGWNNPATWGGEGVPKRNDDAIIPKGFAVNVETVEVLNLEAAGSIVLGNPELPGRLTVYGTLQANGEFLGANPESQVIVFNRLSCLTAQAFFRDLNLIVSGEVVLTGNGGIQSANCQILTSGFTKLFAPPGTNRPVVAVFDNIDLSGRLQLGGTAQLIARQGIIGRNGVALVGQDGGSLIGQDGGSLIGQDGNSLIGQDGASLRGPNGAALIGMDGASLIGQDGNSLIGQDGGSLIGQDGGSRPGRAMPNGQPVGSAGITLESGSVTGTMNFIGNVLNHGAFIMPGNSAGRVRVTGDYTQEAEAGLVLEVGGTQTSPLQFDLMQIGGAANLDGKLIVRTIDGFTPQTGDTFAALTYASVSGNFASVSSNAQVSLGENGLTLEVSGPNPPAPKALNISTRMRVETGDNVLIAGFIVTGTVPKKVMIRGLGPSLPVSGPLLNPTLSLDGGAVTNDNWRSTQEHEIIATTIPPSSDLESAIVATLNPGAHTAVLRGVGETVGVGLVEVYDLEPDSAAQLANISTRGHVQTGDNVMIGGFIVGGDYPVKVIIRAIGPSLPINGRLADPTLELVDDQGNSLTNDNWRTAQEAEIIASTVPPSNDREAAIVTTLVPGNYTAVVRGKDGTTGVALVEGFTLE